jgi:two-component system cell cycle sensor histidine kinase/response regulator CckA
MDRMTEALKLREVQLCQAGTKYRTLVEQITSIIYVTPLNETRRKLHITPQTEAMLGFSTAEWLADQELWFKQLHPDDRERVLTEFYNRHEKGKPIHSEYRLVARDGHAVWVYDEAVVVRDEAGQPCFIQGVMFDISEHRQKEERLQKSEAKFRAIFERVAIGIALTDIEGRFMESNPALQKILGYSEEELHHKAFTRFTHPDDIPADLNLYNELIVGKRDHYQMEKRYIRKDGGLVWAHLNASLIQSAGGESQFAIRMVEDITERKRLEIHFLQSQKMETVGRLAGGVAHDFNNILTVIKGYSQLSLSQIKEGHPLKGNIEEISRATERGEDLTHQLLAFSRRQIMDLKVLNLNALVDGLGKMLRRVIGEDIEMVTVLADDLGRVKVDPGQIEQVILNLAVNARDAMPNGGKLTLETANVELDEFYARSRISVIPGRYVMVSVSDTGCGMSPEVREQIFEPFFTTKKEGKGTGLGLSTVYGIIKQSGGNVWVYSEPGQGTTFKIYLPRVEEEADALPSWGDTGQPLKGSETVLLVEDEAPVRELAARILREQGYKVLKASNGKEAMRIGRKHIEEKIHLLLTDVVMPLMGGKELYDQFIALHSEAKALFVSGYTDITLTHQALFKPGAPFLQKPFSPTNLAKKVREVLDK